MRTFDIVVIISFLGFILSIIFCIYHANYFALLGWLFAIVWLLYSWVNE